MLRISLPWSSFPWLNFFENIENTKQMSEWKVINVFFSAKVDGRTHPISDRWIHRMRKTLTTQFKFSKYRNGITLPPIIMEVKNGSLQYELPFILGDFPLPWLWEKEYTPEI